MLSATQLAAGRWTVDAAGVSDGSEAGEALVAGMADPSDGVGVLLGAGNGPGLRAATSARRLR
jgi:hypothetical protein